MSELIDYCPRCERTTPCEVKDDYYLRIVWTCKVCGFILDEDWIDDECESMAEQQAELEEWGELRDG